MGITKTELAEAISAAIRKEFGGPSEGNKSPGPEGNKSPYDPPQLGSDKQSFLSTPGKKTYQELFVKENETLSDDGWSSFDEFVEVIRSKQPDTRLKTLSEADDEAGGYLVSPQFSSQLMDTALESEIVRPRATTWPMTTSHLKVPGKKITSHATSISGVVAYWIAEKGTKQVSDPAFRMIELIAKKLACITQSSDELVADSKIPIGSVIGVAFSEAIQFELDYAFLQGTGSGQPLGVLNSPCLITVSKETGQAASTILWENIINMWASMYPAGMNRAVWVASISTIPQLLSLSQAIGTGGSHYWPALREAKTGGMTLLTRPIIWTEKLPALGTEGDIMLCDFSQYHIGLRQEVRIESSNAPHFSTDVKDWRAVLRASGQASWNTYLTCKDGSTTVSPFVALETRG